MSRNRQIFTVFHELGHLIYRDSYLDVFDTRMWRLESEQPSHIEVKCNAFAGEFLVPEPDLLTNIGEVSTNDEFLNELAETYHVSKDVILRRFHTLRFIDTSIYERKVDEWTNSYRDWKLEKSNNESDPGGGGNYYNSKMAYLGDAYLTLVLRNYNQGRISMEEAASHLDVKVKSFPVIEEKFLSRSGV